MATDWQKDADGRVSVNTGKVLTSPDTSDIKFVTKAKTQGNLYVHARLMRDAVAPAEPVTAPIEEEL